MCPPRNGLSVVPSMRRPWNQAFFQMASLHRKPSERDQRGFSQGRAQRAEGNRDGFLAGGHTNAREGRPLEKRSTRNGETLITERDGDSTNRAGSDVLERPMNHASIRTHREPRQAARCTLGSNIGRRCSLRVGFASREPRRSRRNTGLRFKVVSEARTRRRSRTNAHALFTADASVIERYKVGTARSRVCATGPRAS